MSEAAETDESRGYREPLGDNRSPKPDGNVHGLRALLKEQFCKLAKALTGECPTPEPPRRRRTEETRGGFILAARRIFLRADRIKIKTRPDTHSWDASAWLNVWEWNDPINTLEAFDEFNYSESSSHLSLH